MKYCLGMYINEFCTIYSIYIIYNIHIIYLVCIYIYIVYIYITRLYIYIYICVWMNLMMTSRRFLALE